MTLVAVGCAYGKVATLLGPYERGTLEHTLLKQGHFGDLLLKSPEGKTQGEWTDGGR